MDPKELKRKLPEQQETRQLLPATSWRKELIGELSGQISLPWVGRGRKWS